MDVMNIVSAVVVLAVMGAVFGLILAVASKVFEVKKDPREEEILGHLAGANCGGCGFAGCSACAAAIVEGKAPVTACAPAGAENAAAIAAIMGMGLAVTFVMGLASAVCYAVNEFILVKFDLQSMQTVAFILVIAALVQFIEMFLQKSMPALYTALGIYLPLITTNCAVLGVLIAVMQWALARPKKKEEKN